jgi:hypothetical protein
MLKTAFNSLLVILFKLISMIFFFKKKIYIKKNILFFLKKKISHVFKQETTKNFTRSIHNIRSTTKETVIRISLKTITRLITT